MHSTAYLNCPRCGLSVRARGGEPAAPPCPRCRGRAGLNVPMYETDRPRPPVSAPAGPVGPAREPQAA